MLAHICLSDKSNFIFPWTQKIFIYSLCVINYPLQAPIIEGVDGKDPKWNLMNVRSPWMSLLQVKYCNNCHLRNCKKANNSLLMYPVAVHPLQKYKKKIKRKKVFVPNLNQWPQTVNQYCTPAWHKNMMQLFRL